MDVTFLCGVRINFECLRRDAVWSCCLPALRFFQGSNNLCFKWWMDDGTSVLMMSGIRGGVGLLKMSWKCSALLARCSGPVEMALPSFFLTSLVCLLLYTAYPYNLFMLLFPSAFSASVAIALKNSFLSFLALFLTFLFNCHYLDVRSLFLACSLCPLMLQVFLDSHSFRLLALLP